MNKQERTERNLRIVEDYKSGMEVKSILKKYNLSFIDHILRPCNLKRGRYRLNTGKCKNHPDKQAVKGTLLCPECKKKYMREYARAHRGNGPRIRKIRMIEKYTAPFIREELPPRLEALRQKYKNLDRLDTQGISVRISDFEYGAMPKRSYFWR